MLGEIGPPAYKNKNGEINMEEIVIDPIDFGDLEPEFTPVVQPAPVEEPQPVEERKVPEGMINCLRNERVKVQFIPDDSSGITDKTHPYYGGMANNAWHSYTVPMLRNGTYKNPLTDKEKEYLEYCMGLERNALSVHKTVNNFWENRQVLVKKDGEILDLSTPMGYINYKILLTNSDAICPSLKLLRDAPKATYKFVLISDNEVYNATTETVSTKSACWKAYGKIEEDVKTLKVILETLTGHAVDAKSGLAFLQEQVVNLIESNPRAFLATVADKFLPFKVIIKDAVEKGVIERRGDYYYYMNNPLCGKNENPTITVAAKYISEPKNQEILFSIQAKLK